MRRAGATRWALHGGLLTLSLVFSAPLLWMLLGSLKPQEQVMAAESPLWPQPVSATLRYGVDNYQAVMTDEVVQFPIYLRNTLLIAILCVAGTVFSSAVVAYGFSRFRWRGRDSLFGLVLVTMMIPFPVLMVPLYVLFRHLGWIGSFRPLWIPAWFGHAFSIFLLRQFFLTIPRELDEAARLDGCGHVGIFRHVILPLSRPALAVVALFQFMAVWNDFLAPLIFLSHRDQYTLALGLYLYQSQQGSTPWNLLLTASTLIVAPLLLIFVLAQTTFIQGIATQGLKG